MGNSKRVARRGTAAKRLPGTRLLMSMFPEVREHTKLKKKTGPLASFLNVPYRTRAGVPSTGAPLQHKTGVSKTPPPYSAEQSRAEEGRRLDEWGGSAA